MDFLERLKTEAVELSLKQSALTNFLNSEKFESVSETQQMLLTKQHKAMTEYLDILMLRLQDLGVDINKLF